MSMAVAADSTPSEDAAAVVFAVRCMELGDIAFVTDSWLRSAWCTENRKLKRNHVNRKDRETAGRSWWEAVRPQVQGLLRSPAVVVLVACDREDRGHIAGWLAMRAGLELRSHIKHAYRPWGVDVLLRTAAEDEIVADTPRRIALEIAR